jgi:hypothetical protein
MMEASVFPERSLASLPCSSAAPMVEVATMGFAKFIGPASANVLGTVNAIVSTIVGSFIDVSFSTG